MNYFMFSDTVEPLLTYEICLELMRKADEYVEFIQKKTRRDVYLYDNMQKLTKDTLVQLVQLAL